MKKYILEIIVFIAGMGIMIFELVGSRVLAPYIGTTIMVWSVLIGTILAALALGYWWGGRVADKRMNQKYFSGIIFMAAVSVGLTALIKLPVINFLDQYFMSFKWEALWVSLILFGPGSFFMAAVSPYAVRLHLNNIKESGEVVGSLYAISTAGSIFGSFLTGIWLVPLIGSTSILFILSGILFFSSILAFTGSGLKTKMGILVIMLLLPFFSGKIDYYFIPLKFIHSAYLDVALENGTYVYKDSNTGETKTRPVLQMYTSPNTIQSAMFTDKDDDLVIDYTKAFRILSEFFNPNSKNSLVIGGAGYSLPKDILKRNQDANVDVIEIDPKMTEIAKEYFNLTDDPRLTTYNEDGRTYLNRNQKKYDVVFMDSFRTYVAPYQLTTLEAVQKIYDSLDDRGIVLVNIIQSINGDDGRFFRAEYKTYKKVFPQLYVLRVQSPSLDEVQNLMLVATKSPEKTDLSSPDNQLNEYLQRFWTGEITMDMPIITDDFAPVADYMLEASKKVKG